MINMPISLPVVELLLGVLPFVDEFANQPDNQASNYGSSNRNKEPDQLPATLLNCCTVSESVYAVEAVSRITASLDDGCGNGAEESGNKEAVDHGEGEPDTIFVDCSVDVWTFDCGQECDDKANNKWSASVESDVVLHAQSEGSLNKMKVTVVPKNIRSWGWNLP